ncbi:putative cyclin-D7-1 [Cynara cardunculus var. scolymus]|uniref:putative cyclin-D7-1 n=1 Tax=Cynara cardunculus var. scolymus TaxID=59895 RepID=UPI000D62DD45|nr:putative cyclin-D7-1 [Cynara cardunculus var. scolymus]
MDEFLLCHEHVCELSPLIPSANSDNKNGFLGDSNEFLLCDEVWDVSPVPVPSNYSRRPPFDHDDQTQKLYGNNSVQPITKEDFEHSFDTYLRKEMKYMPESGYKDFLESNRFVASCRIKAIQWFIHSQRRFNFYIGTVYNAVNYIDRFICINQCHGWNHWMMELLSVASLSIAIKFGETGLPSLHEMQEGLEYCFEAKLIQRMELKIMESLGWELNCVTPHSYVELIAWELNSVIKPYVLDQLTSRLNDDLLASSLDEALLVYRPSVIVMSGLRLVLDDFFPSTRQDYLSQLTSFIPPDQTQNLQTCCETMHQILVRSRKSEASSNPSSPDTVLTKEQVAIREGQVDLSFMEGPDKKSKLKRKRGEEDDHCVMIKKHQKSV